MEIKIYTGGHQATTEHFTKVLEKNKNTLAAQNTVFVPPTDDTYPSIFKASKAIRNKGNPVFIQQKLLQQFNVPKDTKTLIFIDNRTIGTDLRVFEKELFFPKAGGFIKQIQGIFEDFPLRLFTETRDLATLLPSCYCCKVFDNDLGSLDEFLAAIDIIDLRWSVLIDRSQGRGTRIPVTTWRYEEYPSLWRDIAGAVTKVAEYQDFTGPADQLDLNVNLQTALLFYKYTQKYPVQSQEEFDTLKKLFLERDLGKPHKLETPNWTPEIIQNLTHSYEDDWYYIERMEDVEIIQPHNFSSAQPASG